MWINAVDRRKRSRNGVLQSTVVHFTASFSGVNATEDVDLNATLPPAVRQNGSLHAHAVLVRAGRSPDPRQHEAREAQHSRSRAQPHEHRLVAECLFYLARRTDGEWEVEHLCSLAAIIKDLTTSSSDLLEFPKSWTIDEHRTERSEEDVSKKHTAELAHITSVLCVAWWEAVHRTRGRGRGRGSSRSAHGAVQPLARHAPLQ